MNAAEDQPQLSEYFSYVCYGLGILSLFFFIFAMWLGFFFLIFSSIPLIIAGISLKKREYSKGLNLMLAATITDFFLGFAITFIPGFKLSGSDPSNIILLFAFGILMFYVSVIFSLPETIGIDGSYLIKDSEQLNAKGHDVFICYAPEDTTAVDPILKILESRGIRCWVAFRDLLPERDYAAAAEAALKDCEIVVLIFSSHSNNSPSVIRDLNRAVSQNMRIIPYRIEDVVMSKSMQYLIGDSQWINTVNSGAGLETLNEEIKRSIHDKKTGKEFFIPFKQVKFFSADSAERFGASLLDFLIVGFLSIIPRVLLEFLTSSPYLPNTYVIVLMIAWGWFYFTIAETVWNTTPGKKIGNLVVLGIHDEKTTFFSIAVRNFYKVLSLYLFGIPYITLLFSPGFQPLHDIIASTEVRKVQRIIR